MRSQRPGIFLVVEGSADVTVYGQRLPRQTVQAVPAGNRAEVLGAMKLLEDAGIGGCLGVIDADFDLLEGRGPPRPDVIPTDQRDLESMIIASPALERVLSGHGSDDRIPAYTQETGCSPRQSLLRAASEIGILRWASRRREWNLRFSGMTYTKVAKDRDALSVDPDHLVTYILARNNELKIPERDVHGEVAKIRELGKDVADLAVGHDLVGLLSLGLRRFWGGGKQEHCSEEVVEKSLWTGYDERLFQTTHLYSQIMTFHDQYLQTQAP